MSNTNLAMLNSNINYQNPFLLTVCNFYDTPCLPNDTPCLTNNASIFMNNYSSLASNPILSVPPVPPIFPTLNIKPPVRQAGFKTNYASLFENSGKTAMPASTFGILNNNYFNNSKNYLFSTSPANTEISDYKVNTSSKIKPGLLKGNLKGKEALITQLCQKYNVDVALVVSIIGQESGFGTSNLAQHNNFMGYRAKGDAGISAKGFGYFSTPEKGLEAAIRNISNYPQKYADKGVKKADLNNINAIGKIYCEGNDYAPTIINLYNKTVKKYLA